MPQVVYLALGDSLSAGKGDPDPEGNPVGWARRTCSLLSDATGATYAFTNLAVNRATIAEVLGEQVPSVAAATPDLITVTMGINDIRGAFDPGQFGTKVDQLLAALAATDATVVTMTIPNIVYLLPLPAELRGAARQILEMANDAIRLAAIAHGVLFIDAYVATEVADPGFWHEDRMHPNAKGHKLIAAAAADMLLAAGPRRGIPARLPIPSAVGAVATPAVASGP